MLVREKNMKFQIRWRALLQTVLLLVATAFLWLSIAYYLMDMLGVTRTMGTVFLVVFTVFLIAFFENIYQTWKRNK